ncbi:MAG: hypothetical protein L0220_17530 [Acidobacteria bacterium]|nr:hypothetical protein [Acidobacteriota bacterium]
MLKRQEDQTIFTATEVAEYVFCAKAWRLKRDGAVPHSPGFEKGVIFHEQQRAYISRSSFLYRAALICASIAIVLLVLALFR